MSNFAQVDSNGIVIQVLVGDNSFPNEGYDWFVENLGGTWVQTSYNTQGNVHLLGGTPLHKNYAGIGFTWDGTGFAAPKPYDSWTLDADTYVWNAPTPMPTDDKSYTWDEDTLAWVEVE